MWVGKIHPWTPTYFFPSENHREESGGDNPILFSWTGLHENATELGLPEGHGATLEAPGDEWQDWVSDKLQDTPLNLNFR